MFLILFMVQILTDSTYSPEDTVMYLIFLCEALCFLTGLHKLTTVQPVSDPSDFHQTVLEADVCSWSLAAALHRTSPTQIRHATTDEAPDRAVLTGHTVSDRTRLIAGE